MNSIQTVLCPVDFSTATAQQIELGVRVCRAFGARLVIHHNLVEPAVGSAVGWMWAVGHPNAERVAEQRLIDLHSQVPADVRADVRLSYGSVADAVLSVAAAVGADLVVLSTSGRPTDERGTVTERVLERAALPVLAVHTELGDHLIPKFDATTHDRQALLVPTDLTPGSQPALEAAFDLARRFPFDVHLLHVLPANGRTADAEVAEAERRLAAIGAAEGHVVARYLEHGTPVEAIARVAARVSAACIVMGEHASRPLRHWFRRGTTRGVLHAAPCPIWYVPEPRPAEETAGLGARTSGDRSPAVPPPTQRLVEELRTSMFHYWPTARLYAVVDSPDAAESALEDLIAMGIGKDRLQTWYGPIGADTIDPSGRSHGRAARLWRTLERATGERELLDRYAEEVGSGHVCIGVHCGGPARSEVEAVLQTHGGHLLSYFSVGAVERLTA